MRGDGTIVAEGDDGAARKLWLVAARRFGPAADRRRGRDRAPRWYPDGRRVIFSSDRAGSMDLYAVDVTDGTVSALTRTPGTDERTRPSPQAAG